MAVKPKSKGAKMRRRVAQEIAKGATVKDAMLAAGYSETVAENGQILWTDPETGQKKRVSPNNHPEIVAMVEQYQEAAIAALPDDGTVQKRVVHTIHTISDKLEEAYNIAKAERLPGFMVQAAMGQAKLFGLIIDRHKHAIAPIDTWTEEQCMAALGIDDDESRGRTVH